MKRDNLDTVGKATRIFMPILVLLFAATLAVSVWQTATYLLGGGLLSHRSMAELLGDACAVGLIVTAVIGWLLKSKSLEWLCFALWFGMAAGHGYEAGGVTLLAWMAIGTAILLVAAWILGRNPPNFGRAGLKEDA